MYQNLIFSKEKYKLYENLIFSIPKIFKLIDSSKFNSKNILTSVLLLLSIERIVESKVNQDLISQLIKSIYENRHVLYHLCSNQSVAIAAISTKMLNLLQTWAIEDWYIFFERIMIIIVIKYKRKYYVLVH